MCRAPDRRTKPYGCVFYTKGKRLVFYAYDLDAQPGVKNASTFQAWGRRGPDKQQVLNLGIFYEDNISKKRWVLKANDPKTLDDRRAKRREPSPKRETTALRIPALKPQSSLAEQRTSSRRIE
jgi:hypothetical protein